MHIIRAINKDSDTTTPSVLDFFTKKSNTNFKKKVCYGANDGWLYKDFTMPFIVNLSKFWINYENYLNELCCRYMGVLDVFQNVGWKSFVSSLVWKNRKYFEKEEFDKDAFSEDFEINLLKLIKIITLPYLHEQGTSSVIDKIIYKVNVDILNERNIEINQGYKMPDSEESFCKTFDSTNAKKMKYILLLDSYIYDNFTHDISSKLEIEHILPKAWQDANFNGWDEDTHKDYLEQIGNKVLLNKKSNIKCINNFFAKKQEEYKKDINLKEVKELGNRDKKIWDKEDIKNRNKNIYNRIKKFVEV
ncbi:HNH endonuclease family protein [Campylobacter sp. MIT 99-7217]|uniref:HNH endonuclease family protein n=1 Tax=Campylobacter sp. MIT 99-7217 TaxID=535091 RepID=UPI0028AF3E85|nr:HNH endonuclease family protein [Campylobacter sp. MIT 99-7217]